MITYNGEKYIKEQIDSILAQIGENDEILISDNGSKDGTIDIIQSYEDHRIRLFHNISSDKFNGTMKKCYNVGRNAENVLKRAKGDFIFLADQDDVWLPNKVTKCIQELNENDLVITNHIPVDENLKPFASTINEIVIPNLLNTLFRTQFLGCCMAFKKSLCKYILPFPKEPLMHDIWIGIMGLKYGKISLIQEPLLLYRRHANNASVNIEQKSPNSLRFKLMYRIYLLKAYLEH